MREVRLRGRLAATVLCAICMTSPQPARAADLGITGKKLLLKSTPQLVLLSKDPSIGIMGSDPVWVHGGSFCCGDKSSTEIVDEATTFARKGYVNVSINYRLEPGGCTASAPTFTCVTAIQEAHAAAQTAVRFLRTNMVMYGIDETRIAIGGSSAGAITALNVGFTSSEDPTAAVGGAVSLSGAHLFSGGAIDSGDAPSLLFHGTADTVVPYQWGASTWNQATAVGLDSFFTSWAGAGHVPYAQHRTEILDQTTNFLYWELDLAAAAQ